MESKGFSVGNKLKKGWSLMKGHLGFFIPYLIVLALVYAAVMVVPCMLFMSESALLVQSTALLVLSMIVLGWLFYVVMLGLMKSGLKVSRGEKPSFKDLFSTFPQSLNYIIASIFYGIIVAVGLLLFVIPGFVWMAKFSLYPYFIIDKKAGPIEALKMSSKATYGAKWDVWLFSVLSPFIIYLGLFALIIGLFAAIPIVMIVWGLIYHRLTHVQSSQ